MKVNATHIYFLIKYYITSDSLNSLPFQFLPGSSCSYFSMQCFVDYCLGFHQGSCCLRCKCLLLEISEMIALFHLAIVLSVVWFMALVPTNVFWVNVTLIIRQYCVQAIVMIKRRTASDLGIVINSLERWLHRVHPLGFNGVLVNRSLVLCVMLCRSLFVPLSFFFWPLHCLSFYLRFWLPLGHLQTLFVDA